MADLRARYEELLKLRTSKKEAYDEQKARVRMLEERAKEILEEAKTYGVSSIKDLDELIKREEADITVKLNELESALQKSVSVGDKPQPVLRDVSVDDILRIGSQ